MRKCIVLCLALLLALSAFAGGKKESPAAEKKKVVWWTSAIEDQYRPFIKKLFVDSFHSAHQDIELDLVYMEDYYRTTQTAVQAGAGPDILQFGGPGYALEYWDAKQIADMRELGEQYGWSKKLLEWAYESGKGKDGSLITLPLHYETMVLYYNKTKMDELNLRPPTSLQEVEKICSVAKDNNLMGFAHFFARNRWHFPAMWGGYAGHDNFYKACIQEIQWDHPLFVKAMEIWNEQVQKGWWGNDLQTYYSLTSPDCNSALAEGEALMMINGTWSIRSLIDLEKESGKKWDWVQIPALRGGVEPVYELSVGESLALNAKADNPAACARVFDWLFSDKTRAAKLAESLTFSAWFVPLAFEKSDFSPNVDERFVRWIVEFSKETGKGKLGYPIWGYWPPQAKTWAEKELAKVHNGEWTPKEFMTAFQKEYADKYAKASLPIPPKPKLNSPD